ncbi:septal ring lytic transglycosylase RlpA family protein [Shewanella gelidii]|uniref:Endolytic peptidoglycan transglycosylase RlpA n=1 Tax=Shewanella gelidii TaxID=1642821 RepID=A0A917N6X4_9GAMM|nr:septal ring lytic transglycosylase RlpA family protein [Shewanella gelidii]MCL1097053.1 septal ring lytic transglycosylase RlpA family protein [Shewanella gelidii]GGI72170.1 septal ring lipoprotein RlpA [Shewanella gelidii]
MRSNLLTLAVLILIVMQTACSTPSRYKMSNDKAPTNAPDVSLVENAHPKYEPYSRGGNKNYTVRGKSYQVMKSGENFKATGTASWYGAKFHGHLTSNGEVYDMYSMSAAHKTLPLPSYAKVTNLANNKQVIVRVNDRGPFHGNRILDVSYAAAHHLGMLKTGTANIRMEVIYFPSPVEQALQQPEKLKFVQVFVSADKAKVTRLSSKMKQEQQLESRVQSNGQLHKLQLGPFSSDTLAASVMDEMKQLGYPQSFIVHDTKASQSEDLINN